MKVGDLVVCNCEAEIWYKGRPGLLIGFEPILNDPIVQYGKRTMRLCGSNLKKVGGNGESRRSSKT